MNDEKEILTPSDDLLVVKDLKMHFSISEGLFKTKTLKAVDGVTFSIKKGETLGLSANPDAARRRSAER